MATSPWATALRTAPTYAARPAATTAFTPNYPALPTLPSVPAIDEARAPNSAMRSWLLNQLPNLGQLNTAAQQQINASARLRLAGSSGWTWGTDDPSTPQREDFVLGFDPSKGPGEREKAAIRGEIAAGNARGLLYSSMTNQNMAQAVQRLRLEDQQVVNQYAASMMQQQTAYAGQVSEVIGQWTSLYGQDAAWLADHPPAPPPEPTPPPQAPATATSARGEPIIWQGSHPPNMGTLMARNPPPPGYFIDVRKTGSGKWVAVIARGPVLGPQGWGAA